MANSLVDVLRCLGTQAADALLDSLSELGCLGAVRLSSRTLRSFVDDNTVELHINVETGTSRRWDRGLIPTSLARWPRCKHVLITLADSVITSMVLMPFTTPADRQRIERVTLRAEDRGIKSHSCENLVCMLALRLPNLRVLTLDLPGYMSYDALHQHVMYDALGALSHLHTLSLPGYRSLLRMAPLAASTSLCHLRILDVHQTNVGDWLTPLLAAEGIARLQCLDELELPYFQTSEEGATHSVAPGTRVVLHAGLPPSLTQLTLVDTRSDHGPHAVAVSIVLQGGRFRDVDVMPDGLQLHDLAVLAELLLDCPGMGPVLDWLNIWVLRASDNDRGLEHGEQARLHELLGRCTRVQTEEVLFLHNAAVSAVADWLPLLRPVEVSIDMLHEHRACLTLAPAAGPGPAAGSGAGASTSSRPPDPLDLLGAALQSMTAAAGPPPGSCQLQAASGSSGTEGSAGSEGQLVLLRGPFVAVLTSLSQAGTQWVRSLAGRVGAPPGNDWAGAPVLSYNAVPSAATLLLTCRSVSAAVAVAAAARVAAGAAAPVDVLEVAVLETDAPEPEEALMWALQPVIAAFWDGTAHGGEGCTQQERLQCLLALQAQLMTMEVRL